jgi:hypothetical protein
VLLAAKPAVNIKASVIKAAFLEAQLIRMLIFSFWIQTVSIGGLICSLGGNSGAV